MTGLHAMIDREVAGSIPASMDIVFDHVSPSRLALVVIQKGDIQFKKGKGVILAEEYQDEGGKVSQEKTGENRPIGPFSFCPGRNAKRAKVSHTSRREPRRKGESEMKRKGKTWIRLSRPYSMTTFPLFVFNNSSPSRLALVNKTRGK